MKVKYTMLAILSVAALSACDKDKAEPRIDESHNTKIVLSTKATTFTDAPENSIEKIDIYTFRKKNGEGSYTFERRLSDCPIKEDQAGLSVDILLDGSIERIAYFVANTSDENIPLLPTLSSSTTNTQFENSLIVKNNAALAIPLAMTSKQILPASPSTTPIKTELEHASACLDIVNQYKDFVVDSLVLKNAFGGTFLLKSAIPTSQEIARTTINYGAATNIFMFKTDASVLAVYGKYQGIRAVFDIALKNIEKGTRYRVTFKSINDSEVNFISNLQWSVTPWEDGSDIESTPDWK